MALNLNWRRGVGKKIKLLSSLPYALKNFAATINEFRGLPYVFSGEPKKPVRVVRSACSLCVIQNKSFYKVCARLVLSNGINGLG